MKRIAESTETAARGLSVVVPAFNEEQGIAVTLADVREVLEATDADFEILVVDDGSTDDTAAIAGEMATRVLSLPENRGYGAALKIGIAAAHHDSVLIIDADGTYPAEAIPELLELAEGYDMVVGSRVGSKVEIPLLRRPAKWFLGRLASYLVGRRIPDLNSGMRLIRRRLVERFEHLLPSGFSFTTSITLAALCNDVPVAYHPIDYRARLGASKIRPAHAFDFLLLVLRTTVYFNPLKVFLPLGAVFFLGGFAKLIHDLVVGDLSDTAVIAFLGAVILWAVGLLSDQIARFGTRPGTR